MNLLCCNEKPKWVENVRDKGYWFCDTCRKEVVEITHPTLELSYEATDVVKSTDAPTAAYLALCGCGVPYCVVCLAAYYDGVKPKVLN